MLNLGNVVADSTIRIPFNTFNAAGASTSISDLANTDVEIYKDGSVTQRSSDSGVTVSENFDGVDGIHYVTIDLSDNTDSGFFQSGSVYDVAVDQITVDGETVQFWVGRFTIQPASVGSRIKSLKHYEKELVNTQSSGDEPITQVNDDNSIIILTGVRADSTASSAGLEACMVTAHFPNSNNVRLVREDNSGSVTARFTVLEWDL